MADEFDDFDDGIDWGSVPTEWTSPSPAKRPRVDGGCKPSDASPLLDALQAAPTFGDGLELDEEASEEVGDELQVKAIELAKHGENLFLTGKAGTGKSWATKKIVKSFEDDSRTIYVTAPTGIAAINVGGMTINHWGNFQLGEYYEDYNKMFDKQTHHKIKGMDALLIDEISMLDGHLFDVLECMVSILRCYEDVKDRVDRIKGNTPHKNITMSEDMLRMRWETSEDGLGDVPPWGGLQLICVGDFFQLPPVPNSYDVLTENGKLSQSAYQFKVGRQGSYAFQSHAWRHSNFRMVELHEVHRQEEKGGLFECLNDMREGESDLVEKHQDVLEALRTPLPKRNDGIIPTELHSKNYVVTRRNKEELVKLPGDVLQVESLDEVELDNGFKARILNQHGLQHLTHMSTAALLTSRSLPKSVKDEINVLKKYAQEHFFEKECRVPHSIEMKAGAQILLLWNLHFKKGLANGSRGVVTGNIPAEGYLHLIREEKLGREDERPGSGSSDGEDEMVLLTDGKRDKDAAVLASCVSQESPPASEKKKKTHGFDFSGVDPRIVNDIKAHLESMGPTVLSREYDEMLKVATESKIAELPFVRFANGQKRVIRPQAFTKEFRGVGTAIRWQVPLSLAWAISIHKSQGMTIEYLHVDLSDCFAIGQAYVACSRGKSVESMTVKNLSLSQVKTSDEVKQFYHAMSKGKPYRGKIWADTIATFDAEMKRDIEKQREMERHWGNSKRCEKCGRTCVVGQIKTNKNGNQGKFYISCPAKDGGFGHTWELVNNVPPKKAGGTESSANGFKFFVPGVDGAVEDSLESLRFVVTGVFPELGGGFGLKLGRDKMKEMIENFGGKVTTGLSGKTNYVIIGDEPGEKRLEDAKKKGIPTLDRNALMNMLLGKTEPPGSGDASQPSMKDFVKQEAYDV